MTHPKPSVAHGEEKAPVYVQLDELTHSLECLQRSISRLASRLEPVLGPDDRPPAGGEPAGHTAPRKIAQQICAARQTVDDQTNQLESLARMLEI